MQAFRTDGGFSLTVAESKTRAKSTPIISSFYTVLVALQTPAQKQIFSDHAFSYCQGQHQVEIVKKRRVRPTLWQNRTAAQVAR